jgi:hypothetical protein
MVLSLFIGFSDVSEQKNQFLQYNRWEYGYACLIVARGE